MPKKANLADIKKAFEYRGYTLLATEYKNNSTKMLVECSEKHRYETSYHNFQSYGCPYCSNHSSRVKIQFDDIVSQAEKLGFIVLMDESDFIDTKQTKIKFSCKKLGHIFHAKWHQFLRNRCAGCKKQDRKRIRLNGFDLISYDGFSAIVKCCEGHEFRYYSNKAKCPTCRQEKLNKEFQNLLTAIGYTCSETISRKKDEVLVACGKCDKPYETYKTSFMHLLLGARCPSCQNKVPKTRDTIKNGLMPGYEILDSSEVFSSHYKFLVKCNKNHEYFTTWSSIRSGHGRCNICYPWEKHSLDYVKNQIANKGFSFLGGYDEYENNLSEFKLKCTEGHEFLIKWAYFTQNKSPCPMCNTVTAELEIISFLQKIGITNIVHRNRKIIPPLELDIYLPDYNLAIEYCGVYWHSEIYRSRSYHLNKLLACQERGIKLLTIFENEWIERRNIVESIIASKLGLNKKVYARKCDIMEISVEEAQSFFDRHHLQGSGLKPLFACGLRYAGELVSVLSLARNHRQSNSEYVLLNRLCTKTGITVVGGASRLFSFCTELTKYGEIITYADLRWSLGSVYRGLGFTLHSLNKPDYAYVLGQKVYSKQSLKLSEEDKMSGLSESLLRSSQGYLRIWDCGKLKFRWSRYEKLNNKPVKQYK